MPKLLFLNPNGFFSQEFMAAAPKLQRHSINSKVVEGIRDGEVLLTRRELLNDQEILQQLDQTFSKAGISKESKILIFDTCCHSGNSISPILRAFELYGTNEIKLGLVNQDRCYAEIKADLICLDSPRKGCYPFSRNGLDLIRKNTHSIHSSPAQEHTKKSDEYNLAKLYFQSIFDASQNG